MKTLILTALTLTGIALCAPEAQARDRKHSSYGYRSSDCGYSSYERSYDRGCDSRSYYSYSYYRPAPRYYYRPSRSYHYSDHCYTERRHSFRPRLISFLFGF